MESLNDPSGSSETPSIELDIPSLSYSFSLPQVSVENLLIDTTRTSGSPVLQFIYAALKSESPQILPRSLQHGKYLARGQCSQVVAMRWKTRDVAVKRIVNRTASFPKGSHYQAALSKVRQLQKDMDICTHPKLASSGYFPEVLGYGTQDNLPFLVMERADRGTLLQWLYEDREWDTRRETLRQIACAVQALHENGIIHGDIKLENVLIFTGERSTHQAKLCDFSHSTYPTPPSESYQYYGTWPIIPPEVWLQSEAVEGTSCDVWAYSVLLFRVCQYRDDDAEELLRFVPRHDDQPQDLDLGRYRGFLDTVMQTFVTLMNNSITIDANDGADMASLFTNCSRVDPSKRISAGDISKRFKPASSEIERGLEKLRVTSTPTNIQNNADAGDTEHEKEGLEDATQPDWKAFLTTVPMASMIAHRATWSIQKEFFDELVDRSKLQTTSPRESEDAVLMWCKAIGFGCQREPEQYLEFIQEQVRKMALEHDQLQDSSAGEHKNLPEVPILKLLDEGMRKIYAFSAEGRNDEESKSMIQYVRSLGDILRLYDSLGTGRTVLCSAIRFGFPYAATYFSNTADVNAEEPISGCAALHLLWHLPNESIEQVVKELIENGAMLESPSSGGVACPYSMVRMEGTPLSWAVKAGDLVAVVNLLLLGADPVNGEGARCTPLEAAVALYRPELVTVILHQLKRTGRLSADNANGAIGQHIINGLLPTIAHEQDRMKLYDSAEMQTRASSTIEVVLDYWPGDKDILLRYLLTMHVTFGHLDAPAILAPYMVRALFDAWLSVTSPPTTSDWLVPIFLNRLILMTEYEGAKCVNLLDTLLSEHGKTIDLDTRDSDGRTALHHAAIHNVFLIIPVLLKQGAPIEAQDIDGCSPLGLAARMASTESFDLLMDSGAQIVHNVLGQGSVSVLHLAAQPQTQRSLIHHMVFESRHRSLFTTSKVLDLLQGHSAGMNALALCVNFMHLEAIEALVTAGANFRAPHWLPNLSTVLSVREFATLVRYRPELLQSGASWQRDENLDPEEQIANCWKVQQNFYSGCKSSNFEEEGFISFDSRRPRGDRLQLTVFARRTRPSEPFEQEFVSVDVLGAARPNQGASMWEVNDLAPDEDLFQFTVPINSPTKRTVLR